MNIFGMVCDNVIVEASTEFDKVDNVIIEGSVELDKSTALLAGGCHAVQSVFPITVILLP